jgi:hypothetical protein
VSVENQKRLLALLLGVTTILAGVFTWRAGQLGSAAAFADRQSVGQTIKQEEQRTEVALAALSAASAYVRYVADYTEAAALDAQAQQLRSEGEAAGAQVSEQEASDLRRQASVHAAAAGVFGAQSIYTDLRQPSTEPRPFDFEQHLADLQAEVSTGITSPGVLDPQRWADEASDLRSRLRGLRLGALVLVMAAVAYTVAQVTSRRATRFVSGALATVVLVVATAVTFVEVY